MSISRSKWRGWTPGALWRRFNIWRAMRIYARLRTTAIDMDDQKAKADALMRKHAEDPQSRLPLGDD